MSQFFFYLAHLIVGNEGTKKTGCYIINCVHAGKIDEIVNTIVKSNNSIILY